ncbi:hypothetical protein AVEN_146924-1 [Araneus ventricosus]|uniref:Uncharacterized protein n=1 Tax=Araneus ventricosus TaxID=182803 RepID=A0A4Y2NNV4_ARAVE|nr:hypothetical protein AVEN_146924-1 [Araneus ventricosus]
MLLMCLRSRNTSVKAGGVKLAILLKSDQRCASTRKTPKRSDPLVKEKSSTPKCVLSPTFTVFRLVGQSIGLVIPLPPPLTCCYTLHFSMTNLHSA